MEEERALSNLGPDVSTESPHAINDAPRQPRKRFIGRRAAAEKAAARAGQEGSMEDSGAVTARPSRPLRTLNQIPDSILHDESLNAAIAHLPTNYNFEIHKTVHRIRTSRATNIALQFPEGLLLFAPLISDILTSFCPGTETLIMGDVTYGACCIDDFTARALGCDLLVHYGHSCLVPVDSMSTGIKTLYVFVTIGIDVEHLVATVERNFLTGKRIALVGTIQFNATLHAIVPRLRSLGFDPVLPRSAPLSAGEILGCTAPSLQATSKSSSANTTSPQDPASTADMILYLGDGRFHLESILIASPSLRAHTYRYDPYTRRLTHEGYGHEEMHSLRREAINSARKTLTAPTTSQLISPTPPPRTWALILGTLGRQGNPHTLDLIQLHLSRLQIPCITLLLSEISPQKLALMSADVAVWVQVACPRLSIDWGYAFTRPLLSPYEALVSLGVREGAWAKESEGEERREKEMELGTYPMDFYEKTGLGRTKEGDVRAAMEIEVR